MSQHGPHGQGHGHGHGPGRGSHRHFGRRGRGRRRWSWMSRGATPQPDPQVQWAQGCLAQIVDTSVPQNGFLGPQTRQAIRTFQIQQQLSPSGALDDDTVSALQAACSGPQAQDSQGGPGPAPPAPAPASSSSKGGGSKMKHELAPGQQNEFRWDRPRWDRDRERRWEHGRERRWPFLEGQGEGEFPWDRRRWDRDRERRWDRDRERRWPFLETEGEFRWDRRRGEGGERRWDRDGERRWDRDRERRWPFLEAEAGANGQGEVRLDRPWRPGEFRPREPFLPFRPGWRPERGWLFGLPEERRIAWAQSCLAQLLGGWVIQDGHMGPNTAQALRTFQEQRQLPVTGVLDEPTANALHDACGR